ncbi:MAG: DEAD/DEAH box helicase [Phycisphaerae bacterium]|nr:DEAD/DEAH box helicase [Phycisphaerae bacterium]
MSEPVDQIPRATDGDVPLDLALTPSLDVVVVASETSALLAEVRAAASVENRIRQASRNGTADLLLALATLPDRPPLPATLTFWRSFAERYMTEVCHRAGPSVAAQDGELPAIDAPLEDLASMASSAPPMRGGEYVRTDSLAEIWSALDALARHEVKKEKGGVGAWLARRSGAGAAWHRIGRVSFHLAENKRDPDRPFAFLATYAPRLLASGRVQFQPLGRALEEFAGAKQRAQLAALLVPVEAASTRVAWVRELVESGEVFHALAWTPTEAHQFLRDIPLLEESGLLVRVPDWWTRRGSQSTRVRVGVSIGQKRKGAFGAEAMLDFSVALALDGESLSRDEAERILAGADGLVLLKGRWVEVDREKLKRALEQWKSVQKLAGDGISFIEGMRLLAGAAIDGAASKLDDAETVEWSEVRAGAWLEENLRALRSPNSASVTVPPPNLRATLRPYQATGVRWLWMLVRLGLGACLADDMGLGKTIQVLCLLLLMKEERSSAKRKPAILVLPASLVANWKSEIERFAPSLTFRCVHPSEMRTDELKSAAEDPVAFLRDVDVVLTTYSMLPRLHWLSEIDWSVAVVDEAQAIKNPGARQTRSVKALKAQARIALTGTPVENRLTDLWSIFDFACPGLLGTVKTFGGFVKRLEQRSTNQYQPLRTLVAPYILRRLKTDKSIIADLPDKTELKTFCPLSKRQAALYEDAVHELAEALKLKQEGIARRGMILGYIMRFKQLCNHPDQWLGIGAGPTSYRAEDSGKFQRLGTILDEIATRQEKVLVFTQFRSITDPLASFVGTVFGRAALVLHGGTAVGKRKALVDDFQRSDGPPCMILSLKAGGTGLNLTAATHVIHFDRWWSPAVENQATDRAFRIGQTRKVMVHKFVCQGTIEERIDALTRDKAALASEILEGGVPTLVTEMSDKELMDLVRLDIRTALTDD